MKLAITKLGIFVIFLLINLAYVHETQSNDDDDIKHRFMDPESEPVISMSQFCLEQYRNSPQNRESVEYTLVKSKIGYNNGYDDRYSVNATSILLYAKLSSGSDNVEGDPFTCVYHETHDGKKSVIVMKVN